MPNHRARPPADNGCTRRRSRTPLASSGNLCGEETVDQSAELPDVPADPAERPTPTPRSMVSCEETAILSATYADVDVTCRRESSTGTVRTQTRAGRPPTSSVTGGAATTCADDVEWDASNPNCRACDPNAIARSRGSNRSGHPFESPSMMRRQPERRHRRSDRSCLRQTRVYRA